MDGKYLATILDNGFILLNPFVFQKCFSIVFLLVFLNHSKLKIFQLDETEHLNMSP